MAVKPRIVEVWLCLGRIELGWMTGRHPLGYRSVWPLIAHRRVPVAPKWGIELEREGDL